MQDTTLLTDQDPNKFPTDYKGCAVGGTACFVKFHNPTKFPIYITDWDLVNAKKNVQNKFDPNAKWSLLSYDEDALKAITQIDPGTCLSIYCHNETVFSRPDETWSPKFVWIDEDTHTVCDWKVQLIPYQAHETWKGCLIALAVAVATGTTGYAMFTGEEEADCEQIDRVGEVIETLTERIWDEYAIEPGILGMSFRCALAQVNESIFSKDVGIHGSKANDGKPTAFLLDKPGETTTCYRTQLSHMKVGSRDINAARSWVGGYGTGIVGNKPYYIQNGEITSLGLVPGMTTDPRVGTMRGIIGNVTTGTEKHLWPNGKTSNEKVFDVMPVAQVTKYMSDLLVQQGISLESQAHISKARFKEFVDELKKPYMQTITLHLKTTAVPVAPTRAHINDATWVIVNQDDANKILTPVQQASLIKECHDKWQDDYLSIGASWSYDFDLAGYRKE